MCSDFIEGHALLLIQKYLKSKNVAMADQKGTVSNICVCLKTLSALLKKLVQQKQFGTLHLNQ